MLEAAVEGQSRRPSTRSGTEIEHAAEERVNPSSDGKSKILFVSTQEEVRRILYFE
jgi:hypothetical protein